MTHQAQKYFHGNGTIVICIEGKALTEIDRHRQCLRKHRCVAVKFEFSKAVTEIERQQQI
jgi:hypothetical protein